LVLGPSSSERRVGVVVWYSECDAGETGAEHVPVAPAGEVEEVGAGLRRSAPAAARENILCELNIPELIIIGLC
jgi:hypothetical protein